MLSGSTFDIYCSVTTLIGDVGQYFSCGMHHFGLPECSTPRSLEPSTAADLMNRFNMWQIVERQLFLPAPIIDHRTMPDSGPSRWKRAPIATCNPCNIGVTLHPPAFEAFHREPERAYFQRTSRSIQVLTASSPSFPMITPGTCIGCSPLSALDDRYR